MKLYFFRRPAYNIVVTRFRVRLMEIEHSVKTAQHLSTGSLCMIFGFFDAGGLGCSSFDG